jgi:hypothetical protein
MALLGCEAQVDAHFSPFRDRVLMQGTCIVCTKHNIDSEIIFDAPDGKPKRRGSSGSSIQSVWRQC